MNCITIYEFDVLVAEGQGRPVPDGLHTIPPTVFSWLEEQCLNMSDEGGARWLRLTPRRGHRGVQVTSFVGVIRAPNSYQIEVLPKVGKANSGNAIDARKLLIDMLSCLSGFRHIHTDSAKLAATRMPLLEIFIGQYLQSAGHIVKRGLRSCYATRQDNLFALRGKLIMAPHLRQNLYRADRFFTQHDEFTTNRPENRLIHSALLRVLQMTKSQVNQQLARELSFVFAEVPLSDNPRVDFQKVQLDRGMGHYADALAWARLILEEASPLTGHGRNNAPSLLFPMEAVFEAFVAKYLPLQLASPQVLRTQASTYHLVRHCEQNWFRLKPDLVISDGDGDVVVLDTKWKLLDRLRNNGTDKYGLSQSDFYQLQAYGQSYLNGDGDVVLIYPKTDSFNEPLPVFEFPRSGGLRLWVLPFCLSSRRLMIPGEAWHLNDSRPAKIVSFRRSRLAI